MATNCQVSLTEPQRAAKASSD